MFHRSTGWAIQLDSAISVDDREVDSKATATPLGVVADGLTKKAQKLEDKHVEVVDKFSHRHGAERGDWPVLEVVSIKQVKFLISGTIGVRSS
jgi:hypothetical protein